MEYKQIAVMESVGHLTGEKIARQRHTTHLGALCKFPVGEMIYLTIVSASQKSLPPTSRLCNHGCAVLLRGREIRHTQPCPVLIQSEQRGTVNTELFDR
jgi:hypothetical protein